MSAFLPFRCPVTEVKLITATPEDLARINQVLESEPSRAAALKDVEGVNLSLPLKKAWINTTKTHAYLDQDTLPILVPDAAIVL